MKDVGGASSRAKVCRLSFRQKRETQERETNNLGKIKSKESRNFCTRKTQMKRIADGENGAQYFVLIKIGFFLWAFSRTKIEKYFKLCYFLLF